MPKMMAISTPTITFGDILLIFIRFREGVYKLRKLWHIRGGFAIARALLKPIRSAIMTESFYIKTEPPHEVRRASGDMSAA